MVSFDMKVFHLCSVIVVAVVAVGSKNKLSMGSSVPLRRVKSLSGTPSYNPVKAKKFVLTLHGLGLSDYDCSKETPSP